MKRAIISIFCMLLVVACNTPTPEFAGIAAHRVVIGGTTFDVRRKNARAEVIRTNSEYAPSFAAMKDKMEAAVETATGCRVVSLKGDQSLAQAKLDC